MSLRRFSNAQLAQCAAWFDLVETTDEWVDLGPIGEGESQSIRVKNGDTIGVAKPGPTRASDLTCRAAHEKIAFDLAHSLDLPIPRVILWGRDMHHYVRGRSISAWAFPRAAKWDDANRLRLLTRELIESAGPVVSAMRVFHTWISDTDRKSDHTQVDLDSIDVLGSPLSTTLFQCLTSGSSRTHKLAPVNRICRRQRIAELCFGSSS
jgi:hypothetical protein